MRRAFAIVSVLLATLVAGGCEAFVPAPTRPPILDQLARRGAVDLVDPAQLAGFPISRDQALILADRQFAGEFAGGETTVWGVAVASQVGQRVGWIVVRADPQGTAPDSGSASVMVVIDAMTGEAIDFSMRGGGLGVPGRRGAPIPAVPSPAAVDSTP